MKMQNKGPEPFPFLEHEAKLKKTDIVLIGTHFGMLKAEKFNALV